MFPRLFTLGDFFTLHTYGLMVATGLLVGIYVAGRFAPRIGVEPDKVWNLGIYMALAGLLGAKLFLVFSEWGYYSRHLGEIFSSAILHAGGVWHGGLLFAIAVGGWFTWRHQLSFPALGDVCAPGVALGHAFGRLGCFSAGCCWGTATDVAWAVTFTDPYSHQIVGVPLGDALHPTQLYEAGAEALIFGLLVGLWRRRSFSGQVFATYLMLYAAARFIIEFFRGDPRGGTYFDGALSMPQVVSIGLFIVAGVFWFYQRRRQASAAAHAR